MRCRRGALVHLQNAVKVRLQNAVKVPGFDVFGLESLVFKVENVVRRM